MRLRVEHRQRAVGAAERQVGHRLARRRRAAAAARSRAASGRRCDPTTTWRPRFLKPRLPAKKPTISYCDSVAAVTSASAADASRGVRPGTPATRPPVHRAGHVEREQQPLARRLDVAERRVERGVERVDDLAHRRSTRRGREHRGRTRTCAAPRARAIGCTRARRIRSASPSCATAFAVPSEPGASTPTRVIVARLRISAVIGMSSSSASQTSGEVRCSGSQRLARQAGTRGRAPPPRAASSPPGRGRSPRPGAAGRPSSPPRTIHSNSRACSSRDVERRVAGADAARRVGEAEQVAVRHALALAVLDRLVGERVRPAAPRTSGRPRAGASGPSRGSPRRTSRTGTGACRCGHLRQRLERRLPRRLVAETRGEREREQRRVVLRRAARLADRDDLGDRAQAVAREAPLDRLRVLARQLPLATRSRSRPPSRGSGSGAAASRRRPPRRSRPSLVRAALSAALRQRQPHCGTRSRAGVALQRYGHRLRHLLVRLATA